MVIEGGIKKRDRKQKEFKKGDRRLGMVREKELRGVRIERKKIR